jgi:hypothetical protein
LQRAYAQLCCGCATAANCRRYPRPHTICEAAAAVATSQELQACPLLLLLLLLLLPWQLL